uniref:Uncharacterized protein n=1 Tax=Panagrolaimus sp. ES5 TaxID=591445 RepID=A0AC34FWX5_9BILA
MLKFSLNARVTLAVTYIAAYPQDPMTIVETAYFKGDKFILQDFEFRLDIFAIQGYVAFENGKSSCPLASLKPFYFTDETQIIFVQSSYTDEMLYNFEPLEIEYSRRFDSCEWEFIAPPGYGFKVVFLMLNLSQRTQLFVKNSTHIFVKFVFFHFLHK